MLTSRSFSNFAEQILAQANFREKIYQDKNHIVSIWLDDPKYPRISLVLLKKYLKIALCEAYDYQLGGWSGNTLKQQLIEAVTHRSGNSSKRQLN
jgi:hypothetical protein